MIREHIRIALSKFYGISLDTSVDALKKCYLEKKIPDLDLNELFKSIENPLSSQKTLRFSLDAVVYPIETKRLKGGVIPSDASYFLQIMREQVYNKKDIMAELSSQSPISTAQRSFLN